MTSIEDQVLDRLATTLAAAGLDQGLIELLRSELAAETLPRAEQLADLFAAGSGQAHA
jgi:hypothetical protein